MKKISLWLLLVLAATMFWNCSDDSSTETTTPPVNNDAPTISFVSPVAGDSVFTGSTMQITIKMKAGKDLITKVKFLVDGYLNQELTGQTSAADTIRTFNWTAPATVSTHSFKVTAQAPGDLEGSATVANIRVVNAGVAPSNMIFVNGGTFQMGASDIIYATPIHFVTLSPFYIGKYEVTQAEWIATMGINPSYFTGDLNRPVEQVSWYDILVYCNQRSIAEDLTPCYTINGSTNPANWPTNTTWDDATCNWTAKGYRMPTEAEWEFAARGGNSSQGYTYSGSNYLDDVAWYGSNSGGSTNEVGAKLPNELGIYDMSGNIYESTWDWYASYNSIAQTNPTGAASGLYRILRGGSCSLTGVFSDCRVADRGSISPSDRYKYSGFRLARNY